MSDRIRYGHILYPFVMITVLQAAILGLIQGITELFPISSLGHSVILPRLFGWDLDQGAPAFLGLLIATHLATAIVLFLFFLGDWVKVFRGLGRSIRHRRIAPGDTYAKLGWLLVIATIPVGILGLVLEKPIKVLFASPLVAAAFLVVNGIMLFTAERLRRRRGAVLEEAIDAETNDKEIARLTFRRGLGIGTAQAAALIPGISRSGASMVGGLLSGLSHETAARFSFLLATPIIGAAALFKLPEMLAPGMLAANGWAFLVGALCSGLAAWFATRFLLRYFETRSLLPFAIYCVIAGIVYFAALVVIGV